jgi:hypothetical protein
MALMAGIENALPVQGCSPLPVWRAVTALYVDELDKSFIDDMPPGGVPLH